MSDTVIRRALLIGLMVLGVLLATLTRQSAPSLPGEFAARTAPLFGFSFRLGQNARASLAAVFDRRDLRAELRQVQAELQQLRQENQRLRLENRKLQATLRVQAVQGLGVVAVAPVIDDDPSGLYRRLFLGAGSAQGLRVGMPVTTASGLVGVITEVTPNNAVVRTVLDPESRVGVRLASAPGRGIAYGAPPRRLRVEIAPEAQVNPGDKVVTGALQGLYPAGISVGTVEQVLPVSPGALKKVLIVRPSVQLSLLEEVQVLKPL
ncbi:MAG: rod shape-determining protein MreC [Meiothermus sp.]|uniref:rod shape-determining protein MreC n=1 Tax=Meiothermus sp. TaxID=1955249 RepID=UPI0025DADF55|nr:rod shape-determining protein MreC [Meiothermus sp.]MCS7067040.1 rod shape-determining protein MreC [Meiothermus sp.]MCX7600779.1 rod shape-determining protein MreC [Meiothermus sp.]MDW8424549.1 rod shape-determining protein MreC [Meiothermus sp.]